MISEHSQRVAEQAKAIYAEKLQSHLEVKHPNQFVAIEAESEEFFVGETFSKAVAAARKAHPNRISFVIRIGHEAALHIGGVAR